MDVQVSFKCAASLLFLVFLGAGLTQAGEPPLPPASISYPSSSSIGACRVSWASSSSATSYQLEKSLNSGSWYGVYSGPNTSRGREVCNGSYRYRVKATNVWGSSDWRTGTSACTVSITPLPPLTYVDIDAPDDDGDGRSWATAFKYLQNPLWVVKCSPSTVEIRVAEGTYKPDQGSGKNPGDRYAMFKLNSNAVINGGYAGCEPDPQCS